MKNNTTGEFTKRYVVKELYDWGPTDNQISIGLHLVDAETPDRNNGIPANWLPIEFREDDEVQLTVRVISRLVTERRSFVKE